jgi:hypothetical protein
MPLSTFNLYKEAVHRTCTSQSMLYSDVNLESSNLLDPASQSMPFDFSPFEEAVDPTSPSTPPPDTDSESSDHDNRWTLHSEMDCGSADYSSQSLPTTFGSRESFEELKESRSVAEFGYYPSQKRQKCHKKEKYTYSWTPVYRPEDRHQTRAPS